MARKICHTKFPLQEADWNGCICCTLKSKPAFVLKPCCPGAASTNEWTWLGSNAETFLRDVGVTWEVTLILEFPVSLAKTFTSTMQSKNIIFFCLVSLPFFFSSCLSSSPHLSQGSDLHPASSSSSHFSSQVFPSINLFYMESYLGIYFSKDLE